MVYFRVFVILYIAENSGYEKILAYTRADWSR